MPQVGFTAADPHSSKSGGYRSWKLAKKSAPIGATYWLSGSEISYNGFVFPPTVRAKATVVPEYSKDKRTVKFHQVIITVECYITQYDIDAFAVTSTPERNTIDAQMDDIKTRLMQPCQPLKFTLQGFGDFHVNTTDGNFYDVNYGPKPQVVEWEPMGGALCARIEWLVTTAIPPCGNDGQASGLNGILDMWYEIAWSVADAGFLRRTISGGIELAATRTPSDNSVHASIVADLTVADAQYRIAMERVRTTFPALGGWERAEDFKLSLDKKTLNYNFVDTEVPSSQAFPEGILRINMTESLSSSFEKGFYTWDWSFSGDIDVPRSDVGSDIPNNKRLAYAAFGMIINDRLKRVRDLVASSTRPYTEDTDQQEITVIPNKISISSEMFGNSISVEFSFALYITRSLLFAATGMFDQVSYPGLTWKNWRDFITRSQTRLSLGTVFPGQDMIVDLCHPVISDSEGLNPPVDRNPSQSPEPETSFKPQTPEKKDATWLPMKSQFIFKIRYHTVAGVLLSEETFTYSGSYVKSIKASEIPSYVPKPLGIETQSEEQNQPNTARPTSKPDLSTASEITVHVTWIGQVSRIGFDIQPPEILSVGDFPAVHTGTDVIIPSHKTIGIKKGGTNKETVLYSLKWKRNYVIDGLPTTWNVVTDAPDLILQNDGHALPRK